MDAVLLREAPISTVSYEHVGTPHQSSKPSPSCMTPGCNAGAIYTSSSASAATTRLVVCAEHRTPSASWQRIRKKRYCHSSSGCEITANFGWPGGRPLFCASHREKGMINTMRMGRGSSSNSSRKRRPQAEKAPLTACSPSEIPLAGSFLSPASKDRRARLLRSHLADHPKAVLNHRTRAKEKRRLTADMNDEYIYDHAFAGFRTPGVSAKEGECGKLDEWVESDGNEKSNYAPSQLCGLDLLIEAAQRI